LRNDGEPAALRATITGMGSADDGDNPGSLPPRESWHHILWRPMVYSYTVFSAVGLVLAISWIFARGRDSPSYVVASFSFVSLFVMFGFGAWAFYKTRIEADLNGLHIIMIVRRKTFPWTDIAEIRPRNTKRFKRWLVLVTHGGKVIDFPLDVEHLPAVRRWQAAAAGTQHSP
jgi:hypothetical protein